MTEQEILEVLLDHGLIVPEQRWSLVAARGGLNSRVFLARREDAAQPALTVRLRDRTALSIAEAEGLADAAECPGVPQFRLLTDEILVHDFVAGHQRPLEQLDRSALRALARSLTCIHAKHYPAFTLWPSRELREGSRAELFRFRVASFAHYDCYTQVQSAREPGDLGYLLQHLSALKLASPTWNLAAFSRLHGDLSRGNLLWREDAPGLIDWEYSRIGDPAEDVAYLLTEHGAEPEHGSRLLASYEAAGGDPNIGSRLATYAFFTAVDAALWWIDYGNQRGQDTSAEVARRIGSAQAWQQRASS